MTANTGALRMEGISAGEVGGVFAGFVALLASLGAGVRWLINWSERREETREARLNKLEESLRRREQEIHEKTEARLSAVEEKLSAVTMALFETLGELQRLDPASPVLARATMVLREAYPLDPETPPAMKALVRRLDNP